MNSSARSSSVSATAPSAGSAASSGEGKRKTYMPNTLKVTVLSGTSRQNTGIVATLSGLDRKEVDKAFAQLKKDGAIVSPVRCKWQPAE